MHAKAKVYQNDVQERQDEAPDTSFAATGSNQFIEKQINNKNDRILTG
jgi:hypothetical protein